LRFLSYAHYNRIPLILQVFQPLLEIAVPGGELEADVAIPGNNGMDIEAVEVQVEEVMMDLAKEEVVQDDIEYVDLLPADAAAEFEFRDALDVLLPDVYEEVSKYIFLLNKPL